MEDSPNENQLSIRETNQSMTPYNRTSRSRHTQMRNTLTPSFFYRNINKLIVFSILYKASELLHHSVFRNALQGHELQECITNGYNLGDFNSIQEAKYYCEHSLYDFGFIPGLPNNGKISLEDIYLVAQRYPVLKQLSNIVVNTIFFQDTFQSVVGNVSRLCTTGMALYHREFETLDFQRVSEFIGTLVLLMIVYIILSHTITVGRIAYRTTNVLIEFVNRSTTRSRRTASNTRTRRLQGGAMKSKKLNHIIKIDLDAEFKKSFKKFGLDFHRIRKDILLELHKMETRL